LTPGLVGHKPPAKKVQATVEWFYIGSVWSYPAAAFLVGGVATGSGNTRLHGKICATSGGNFDALRRQRRWGLDNNQAMEAM
jgi:hypothetical protein